MELVINSAGTVRCLYGEEIELRSLGQIDIERASQVEPNRSGQWTADLTPVGGPVLGPFPTRSDALLAEQLWIETYVLNPV